jgi:hypothetical protein
MGWRGGDEARHARYLSSFGIYIKISILADNLSVKFFR